MQCRANECDRDALYKTEQLCQKHYFRLWRKGYLELDSVVKTREFGYSRKQRVTMPGKGYQRLYDPSHPLSDKAGYVSEHRKIVYEQHRDLLPPCQLCGKELEWATCHIDHIDCNVKNNSKDNLRPLCNACNTRRFYPEQHTMSGHHSMTFNGETKTPHEWSKDPRIEVSYATILQRKCKGMSDVDALFSAKKTHNGNVTIDRRPRKTNAAYERSNSIPIKINGVTKTSEEWERDANCPVTANTILSRVRSGWNHVDAVFVPARKKPNHTTNHGTTASTN